MTDGLALARDYHEEAVRPLLAAERIPYAAARIGTGSDVLGVDDATSRDHDWGLRLQVLVAPGDVDRTRSLLVDWLPAEFAGHPTRFAFTGQDEPVLALDVLSVENLLADTLGFDPRHEPSVADWLSLSGQAALQVTAGEVFHDEPGDLTAARAALAWYPDDVWRYLVSCEWQRVDQELPLMGRAGQVGDDLGSRVIAARLADGCVRLAFLLSRAWAPYPKWRGTLLRRLPLAAGLVPHLDAALAATGWQERQAALGAALTVLARAQADAGLPTADPVVIPFWDRPFVQLDQELVAAQLAAVRDPAVAALAPGVGGIDQVTDNVDVLTDPARRRSVTGV